MSAITLWGFDGSTSAWRSIAAQAKCLAACQWISDRRARYFDGPKSSFGISISGMSIFTLVVSITELSIQ